MRRIFVAGNWKMNLDRTGAEALASGLAKQVGAESVQQNQQEATEGGRQSLLSSRASDLH